VSVPTCSKAALTRDKPTTFLHLAATEMAGACCHRLQHEQHVVHSISCICLQRFISRLEPWNAESHRSGSYSGLHVTDPIKRHVLNE